MTAKAIRTQRLLPPEFLLLGYLTKEQLNALLQCNHDKAEQQLTHLYIGLCTYLCVPIWNNYNKFIHGNTGIVNVHKHKHLLTKLAEWKHSSSSLSGVQQVSLANYDLNDVSTWQTSSMAARIRILALATCNRHTSCTVGQTLVTTYFPTANQPL